MKITVMLYVSLWVTLRGTSIPSRGWGWGSRNTYPFQAAETGVITRGMGHLTGYKMCAKESGQASKSDFGTFQIFVVQNFWQEFRSLSY